MKRTLTKLPSTAALALALLLALASALIASTPHAAHAADAHRSTVARLSVPQTVPFALKADGTVVAPSAIEIRNENAATIVSVTGMATAPSLPLHIGLDGAVAAFELAGNTVAFGPDPAQKTFEQPVELAGATNAAISIATRDDAGAPLARFTAFGSTLCNATGIGHLSIKASVRPQAVSAALDANGGSCPHASITVTPGGTWPELPEASRDGHAFLGWFTQRTGGSEIVAGNAVSLTTDVTLYAHWEALSYDVTFDHGNGTVTTVKVSHGSTLEGKLPAPPLKDGYEFDRWADALGREVTATTTITAPLRVTAQYRQVEAFAVYSADDSSLRFFKRASVPEPGDTIDAVSATEVYKGIEWTNYSYSNKAPWHAQRSNITSVTIADRIAPRSMSYWFADCASIAQASGLENIDTTRVTSMNSMFYGCAAIAAIDGIAGWNTSNVTNMSSVFRDCYKLSSLDDISGWNVSKVTMLAYAFSGCRLTSLDLSGWNVSRVNNMIYMFSSCSRLVTLDLGGWETRVLNRMDNMFENCRALTAIVGIDTFFTGNVWSFTSYGSGANIAGIFKNCSSLTTLDLSRWDVSNATSIAWMFNGCSQLTSVGDLSGWNTSKVTSIEGLFYGCRSLPSIESISHWDTSQVKGMGQIFYGCNSLTSLDLSSWDTSRVTSLYNTFGECSALTSVGDISGWNTANVQYMHQLFYNCYGLTSLDLSKWDVSNVTNMRTMFHMYQSTSSLVSVGDLSGWNTSKVTDMSWMFANCRQLTSIGNVSRWNVSSATTMQRMFANCTSLAADCSAWSVPAGIIGDDFNDKTPGVIAPAWPT